MANPIARIRRNFRIADHPDTHAAPWDLDTPLAASAVDHYVLLVGAVVDPEGTERKFVEVHTRLLVLLYSGALSRCDGREGGPALFYIATAAVRAGGLFVVVFYDGQDLLECILAGVADELVVGHTNHSLVFGCWNRGWSSVPFGDLIPRTLLAYGADD